MFELLLQADRALADGALDQAERTYWQLVELDPTNAIAFASLAQIALERGDRELAGTLADRALGIDPDSIAARRILVTRALGPTEPGAPVSSDLPLLAVQRLEALSKRRSTSSPAVEPARSSNEMNHKKATDVPSAEPMRGRRQVGRLAAAAAAAAAAAREPAKPRHEPHHAMPKGRRLFEPEELKPPPADEFFAAEMAAVVEAVDALDDAPPVSEPDVAESEPARSVAAAQLDPPPEENGADEFEAAEAVAVSEARRELILPAHEAAGEAAERMAEAEPLAARAEGETATETGPASVWIEPEPLAGTPDRPPSRAEPSGKNSSEVNTPRRRRGLFRLFRGK